MLGGTWSTLDDLEAFLADRGVGHVDALAQVALLRLGTGVGLWAHLALRARQLLPGAAGGRVHLEPR